VDYTLRFMLACATLAVHHPAVRFVVKMKDPSQIDEVMKYGEFVRVCEKVKNNFEILSRERYRYRDVLDESDIVIAIGFTTPGAEALLMGKRALYYSELSCGGQAFRHIPDFVAHDPDELLGLFQKAMSDHDSYSRTHRIAIAQLDPFCDGHAIDRIAEKLRILMEADGVR
jgi:polysaccharide biosynthesis PFTS motif protein